MSQSPAAPKRSASSGPGGAPSLPSPKERRRLREAKSLSQTEVAAKLGVSRTTVRGWETGRTQPSGRRRAAYARFLASIAEAGAPGPGAGDPRKGDVPEGGGASGEDASEGARDAVGQRVARTSVDEGAVRDPLGEEATPGSGGEAAHSTVGEEAVHGTEGEATARSTEGEGAARGSVGKKATRSSGGKAAARSSGGEAAARGTEGAAAAHGSAGEEAAHGTEGETTARGTEAARGSVGKKATRSPGGKAAARSSGGEAAARGTEGAAAARGTVGDGAAHGTEGAAAARGAVGDGAAHGTEGEVAASGAEGAEVEGPGVGASGPPRGPEEAFDALCAGTAPTLVRQAFALTGRRALAEEAVERAFQHAWQRWPEVAVDRDPAGWVRAVAHEYALSPWHRFRPAYRRPDVPPAEEADRALLRVLLSLTPAQRRTLLLYDGVGLDLPETAAETEASTPAAAYRLMNARDAVAEQLPDTAGRPDELHRGLDALGRTERLRLPRPARVRIGSERRARVWTRAAIAFTTLIIGATALTVRTAPTRYEPPQSPGRAISGVPPHMGPGPLSYDEESLRQKLRKEPGNTPARLTPLPR